MLLLVDTLLIYIDLYEAVPRRSCTSEHCGRSHHLVAAATAACLGSPTDGLDAKHNYDPIGTDVDTAISADDTAPVKQMCIRVVWTARAIPFCATDRAPGQEEAKDAEYGNVSSGATCY